MRFRRKRRRATWFPVLGQEWPGAGTGLPLDSFFSHTTGHPSKPSGAGNYVSDIFPVTWDYPADTEVEAFQQVPSLADWQGSAWQLEGIKGAVRVCLDDDGEQQDGSRSTRQALIAAFFEVLRVNPSDGAPIETDLTQYSTFLDYNRRDPYIWQRSWMLGTPGYAWLPINGTGPGYTYAPLTQFYPRNNVGYESALTGSLIDAKSKRYIGTDERLFMCVEGLLFNSTSDGSVAAVEPYAAETNPGWGFTYDVDIRVLGRLRKATNRKNASR